VPEPLVFPVEFPEFPANTERVDSSQKSEKQPASEGKSLSFSRCENSDGGSRPWRFLGTLPSCRPLQGLVVRRLSVAPVLGVWTGNFK